MCQCRTSSCTFPLDITFPVCTRSNANHSPVFLQLSSPILSRDQPLRSTVSKRSRSPSFSFFFQTRRQIHQYCRTATVAAKSLETSHIGPSFALLHSQTPSLLPIRYLSLKSVFTILPLNRRCHLSPLDKLWAAPAARTRQPSIYLLRSLCWPGSTINPTIFHVAVLLCFCSYLRFQPSPTSSATGNNAKRLSLASEPSRSYGEFDTKIMFSANITLLGTDSKLSDWRAVFIHSLTTVLH